MTAVAAEIERRLAVVSAVTPPRGVEPAAISSRWRAAPLMMRTPTTLGGASGEATSTPTRAAAGRGLRAGVVATAIAIVAATAVASWRTAGRFEAAPAAARAPAAAPVVIVSDDAGIREAPAPDPDAVASGAGAPAPDAASRSGPETSPGRRDHPTRMKQRSENRPSLPTAPVAPDQGEDRCRTDEQGNVIDRHRCKE